MLGVQVRGGDLDGPRGAAGDCDRVVHLAFTHDEQHAGDLAGAAAADLRAIRAIGDALLGSGWPFVGTTATGALAGQAGRAVLRRAVAPSVHGLGRFGFGSGLIDVFGATGISGYAVAEPDHPRRTRVARNQPGR